MFKIVIFMIVGFGLLIGFVKYIEAYRLFFPLKKIFFTPGDVNLPYEDLHVKTEDNIQINAWFIPSPRAKYTILFCHGNAGNIGDRLEKITLFHKLDTNVFIIDYRGFGRSQGKPSERGLYSDARAAYNYLLNSRHIQPEHIILYGESIGSAVVINLAAHAKIKALIVEGAFSRGSDLARRFYPFIPAFLFSYKFDSLSQIKRINSPKLFIHSRDDEIIPFILAKRLFDSALQPKIFVELTGGHNTSFLDSKDKYTSSILKFIEKL